MPAGKATLIRANGEKQDFNRSLTMTEIRKLINAEVLDSVNLKEGHVLVIDDNGIQAGKPPNAGATFIYQRLKKSTNKIYGDVVIGDVVIVWDNDYA
jgi:hypothetical protein